MKDNTRKYPYHDENLRKESAPIIFLTVCCEGKAALLDNDKSFDILTNLWLDHSQWIVGDFVIMPDHLHLVCCANRGSIGLASWVRYWKSEFSKNYKLNFPEHKKTYIWQKDFWDTFMRSSGHYNSKLEYIHNNPAKAGLVNHPEDWKYRGQIYKFKF